MPKNQRDDPQHSAQEGGRGAPAPDGDVATAAETPPAAALPRDEAHASPVGHGASGDGQPANAPDPAQEDSAATVTDTTASTSSNEASGARGIEAVETAVSSRTDASAIASSAQPTRGAGAALGVAAIAVVAVAVLGWQVFGLHQIARELGQTVAQRLAGSETAVAELRALARQNNEALGVLQGRFGALESQVAAMEGQAATLELLYRESARSRADQVLAELEQAITIASQQLQLAGNFEAALIALQSAEARLAAPEFGHLQPLRRALVRDIEALKAHPQVDVSGIALRLELVLERIDALPLAFEVKLAELAAEREAQAARADQAQDTLSRALGFVHALGADIWREVKGMVRLERLDRADPVLLGPEQSTYLRENLKIRLLTARLALLARDGRTYVTDLERAQHWLQRYFDAGDEHVGRILNELAALAATPIRADVPALTDTFAALRLLQARGAAEAVSEADDADTTADDTADAVR